MREGFDVDTREQLLESALYPYRKLIEQDLIDGVMVGHHLLPNIDPDRPATLSRPVVGILREIGFDGFAITDALGMMGVAAKYGPTAPTAM
jgi:beta-glucosidase-like glycosyl hydrolase